MNKETKTEKSVGRQADFCQSIAEKEDVMRGNDDSFQPTTASTRSSLLKFAGSMLSSNVEDEIKDLRERILCLQSISATTAESPRSSSSVDSFQNLDALRRRIMEKSELSEE